MQSPAQANAPIKPRAMTTFVALRLVLSRGGAQANAPIIVNPQSNDDITYLEIGAVPGPGPRVAGVEEAVAKEDKVARARALARDLVELALLHQLPPRPYQLPIAQAGLQPQHTLELILQRVHFRVYLRLMEGTVHFRVQLRLTEGSFYGLWKVHCLV